MQQAQLPAAHHSKPTQHIISTAGQPASHLHPFHSLQCCAGANCSHCQQSNARVMVMEPNWHHAPPSTVPPKSHQSWPENPGHSIPGHSMAVCLRAISSAISMHMSVAPLSVRGGFTAPVALHFQQCSETRSVLLLRTDAQQLNALCAMLSFTCPNPFGAHFQSSGPLRRAHPCRGPNPVQRAMGQGPRPTCMPQFTVFRALPKGSSSGCLSRSAC